MQQRRVITTYGLWLIDMLCILLAYMIATQLRYSGRNDWGDETLHYMVCVVFLLVSTMYVFFQDWNRDFLVRGYFQEFTAIMRYMAILVLVSLSIVFFARWAYILSRSVILNFCWMAFVLTWLSHLLFKKLLHRAFSNEALASRLIVIAEKDRMRETLESLSERIETASYRIVGAAYADLETAGEGAADDAEERPGESVPKELRQTGAGNSAARARKTILGVPIYSGYRNLTETMTQVPFDEVFISAPNLPVKDIRPMIDGFEEMGVVCHYDLNLPGVGKATKRVESLGPYTVATYTMFRSSYKRLLIKRLIDIAGGVVGLVLTGLLTVLIAPAIKLDSPGPVFFSQVRVGKNGRRFRIYKFRSMYRDAEARLKELQAENEMSGPMFKMTHDPRITRVGAFLRRTSLDEFPQFWNVLKGDMSLVGTRPPTEAEFVQYNEHYRRRVSMTPGLTGLWQVSGRSNIEKFDDVVKLDLEYIDNWSLTLDFKILLMTVAVLFTGRGAR